MNQHISQLIETLYREESRRVLATLLRLLHGNFELAEEALQDAFAAALKQWPAQGVPDNPRAWLVSAGRFKAIDQLRKRGRQDTAMAELARELDEQDEEEALDEDAFGDDRLRLIFTCCHPALSMEARVALTLREVCGLTTEAIAAAFLVPVPTLAQRIVRAKNKILDAAIPYAVPEPGALAARLDGVLQTIYLVFNEGYSASSGESLLQAELSAEAIRLGRLLHTLLPEPEVTGLLALMLLHDARGASRVDAEGDLVPLEAQDRSLWQRPQIEEGAALVVAALHGQRPGPFGLQAAIAALHAEAPDADATDWAEIAAIYALLLQLQPSPVVELNRAVAVAMRDGPAAGLALIEQLEVRGELQDYYLLYAARADLYRRAGQVALAREAYRAAIERTRQAPERRFLEKRLAALEK
ncbi:RNA polymerase sigma factor [Parahaliea aestuarii]|uniref:RNA polymerase sigma factor n=1 Tax=Parahaliea aestuarii TaxID=1852021 RepID=A0A5C9A155_9GAMM|nr:RNA polymerase sigma factor [Parahaliea aestuarii]TXS93500.1 RNA polymerase sigma factor [Parahaliea aestuarii]